MPYRSMLAPDLAEHYRASGQWLNKTVFELLEEKASAHPDHEVFADERVRPTYSALKERVERCAAYLKKIDINLAMSSPSNCPTGPNFPSRFSRSN
jgi:non-ribosomal peptide synthetase component E (peptide arylation enzyme)